MKPLTTIRPHITKVAIITTLFFFAFVTNVAWSQWSDPQQKPTGGNTPAPINEGSANQEKAGSLGIVGNLTVGVPGAGGTIISHNWTRQKNTNPTMIFEDTNGSNWYAHVNNNHFYLLQDYNSGGPLWDSLGWHPMEMAREEANGIAYNWVRFGDQVRAGSFCDHNGDNCIVPGQSGGGTCRTVDDWSSGPNHVAIASCAANETMRYGGGACTDILDRGRVNASHPSGNSWVFDCYGTSGGESAAWATAVCCIN